MNTIREQYEKETGLPLKLDTVHSLPIKYVEYLESQLTTAQAQVKELKGWVVHQECSKYVWDSEQEGYTMNDKKPCTCGLDNLLTPKETE